jgi:UDP-glucose 4-epimerase
VWLNAGVSLDSLMTLKERFQMIVHCAGNGSVGYSLTNPLQDFNKTVQSTVDLLEFVRLTRSEALLIYPSSAGVYGSKPDSPIKEDDPLKPISPYGVHKRVAEELLEMYSQRFGARIAIIRFFSIYGAGLTKQLLWDASVKLRAGGDSPALFWGTGEETRDWIYSEDAADLVMAVSREDHAFRVMNGASGIRTTVRETLTQLCHALHLPPSFRFNDVVRDGDPRFYHADVSKAKALGWTPSFSLERGIARYADWLVSYREQPV